MIRYWLEFDDLADPNLPAEVGVTASDIAEAISLVRSRWEVPESRPLAPKRIIEGVRLDQLPDWVHASVGVPVWRGIWYPVSGIEAG